MPLVDTHNHIDVDRFDKDRDEVLRRAWDAGVEWLVIVGSGEGLPGARRALAMAREMEQAFATIGVHPHEAKEWPLAENQEYRELASDPNVVGIGEIGLDYHYLHSPPDVQQARFREFIELAGEVGKPVVVHSREAKQDTVDILRDMRNEFPSGVMHCFSGDYKMAKACLDLGLYLSISGVVTFKNARDLREVVEKVPVERMVIETDSPYLTPAPHRGKRNEPAFVSLVAKKIAEIKKLSVQDVERITTQNARRLFGMEPGVKPSITYRIRNSLYVNLTNRCTLACTFCPKFVDFMVKGYFLKIGARGPRPEEVLAEVDAASAEKRPDEVVFCGYGEPTLRLAELEEIARALKARGHAVRLNTDGLANLVHGRDVTPELAGIVDSVSVSLNAQDAETYARHCPSRYGAQAYTAVKEFIRAIKAHVPDVQATVVGLPDIDVEACRRIAEEELGVRFRFRPLDEVG
jgi:TatD DNase family protein